jgi:hypothetical protein
LRVHAVCGYRSKNDEWKESWSKADYRAWNLVKALKREAFKGFANWTNTTTNKVVKVENTPEGQAVALEVAVAKLVGLFARAGIAEARVVPIPSSQTVCAGGDYTGARIARRLEQVRPNFQASIGLHFDEPQPKAHKGGSRRWQDILPHLRGAPPPPGNGPVVLLDDVLTSGGHARACARYLAALGCDVTNIFVVGRTVWARPADMFDMPIEELATW